MATLKDISMRLKSVTNIQKITKTMKLISATKFSKAERELKPARSYGQGASAFFDQVELPKFDETSAEKKKHLILAITSDRGLCGAANSTVVKAVRTAIDSAPNTDIRVVAVGEKSRSLLSRGHASNIMLSFREIGKRPITFTEASKIGEMATGSSSGFDFDVCSMYYNCFRSVVSYKMTVMPLYSTELLSKSANIDMYDSVDQETLASYNEFAFASLIYFALKEAAASEQSARMTAMENATKNAGEMIDSLRLTYNRTRQAVITRELIEIISGAAAV